MCPGCGLHESIHSDPDRAFTFEDRFCSVCRGQAAWARVVAASDQEEAEAHKDAPPKEPRPSDGRHTYLRQMTPEEVEKRKGRRERARRRATRDQT